MMVRGSEPGTLTLLIHVLGDRFDPVQIDLLGFAPGEEMTETFLMSTSPFITARYSKSER
jgi:hypothetical protein